MSKGLFLLILTILGGGSWELQARGGGKVAAGLFGGLALGSILASRPRREVVYYHDRNHCPSWCDKTIEYHRGRRIVTCECPED